MAAEEKMVGWAGDEEEEGGEYGVAGEDCGMAEVVGGYGEEEACGLAAEVVVWGVERGEVAENVEREMEN